MYKSLFISDTHLGTSFGNSRELLELIENIEAEQLFLVGDIFNQSVSKNHPDVVRFIELIGEKRWKVIYIAGNNEDERVEPSVVTLFFKGELLPKESYVYNSIQTSIYLEHGHGFHDNGIVNRVLRQGMVYIKWLLLQKKKIRKVKRSYVTKGSVTVEKENFYHLYIKPFAQRVLRKSFKSYIVTNARKRGCSIAICGHFHTPQEDVINGIRYINCGDWVRNRSYVIENKNGEFFLMQKSH